jgi:hypothetical protein
MGEFQFLEELNYYNLQTVSKISKGGFGSLGMGPIIPSKPKHQEKGI